MEISIICEAYEEKVMEISIFSQPMRLKVMEISIICEAYETKVMEISPFFS